MPCVCIDYFVLNNILPGISCLCCLSESFILLFTAKYCKPVSVYMFICWYSSVKDFPYLFASNSPPHLFNYLLWEASRICNSGGNFVTSVLSFHLNVDSGDQTWVSRLRLSIFIHRTILPAPTPLQLFKKHYVLL